MFGFSRRRTKLARLKVQLSDSTQGIRSPVRNPKRNGTTNGEGEGEEGTSGHSDENYCHTSSQPQSTTSDNWMVLSIAGDKPTPRSNHAAAVVGNKMIVVGGESGNGFLDDVQVLNFDTFSWTTASSKLYLSPSSLPLKIPACKGHCLVSWGKKVLLIGGKTDPESDKISVWAFDTEIECWSLMEAKGDIPVARSGHSVVMANSVLILFGGEDAKRRKLNDLHMFDLKSLTWLPLHYTGAAPCPRFNHVASLHDDKILYIFGGSSKSRTLNDLYSLNFETMAWSRVKIQGFHPSPRAGCCGVLCGTKWYITGGGSKKKRDGETLIFDIVKSEWSVAFTAPPSSIITSRGFSLVYVQHKEKDFLVAFGGSRKDPTNQVEVLIMEKNELAQGRRSSLSKGLVDSARQNLASAIEHGSGRKSLSESLVQDSNFPPTNLSSLPKQFELDKEYNTDVKIDKNSDQGSFPQVADQRRNEVDYGNHGAKMNVEEKQLLLSEILNQQNQGFENIRLESDDASFLESNKFGSVSTSSLYHYYESKMAALIRKNGILEGQLAASLANKEAAEKCLASAKP